MFGSNLPPRLLAEWPGSSVLATVIAHEWNGYQNQSQLRNWTTDKKILLSFLILQGIKPMTFQSGVRCSTNFAIPNLYTLSL